MARGPDVLNEGIASTLGERVEIVSRAETAGVVGPGGRPLADALSRRLEVVIADLTDSEPLQASDRTVVLRYPEQLAKGLLLAMEASQAPRGFLAVRASDAEVLKVLTGLRRRYPALTLLPVDDVYPAAEPAALLREAIGLNPPPGVAPEDVGGLITCGQSLLHLAEAARGRPVTHRFVTVVGEVNRPQVIRAPLGLPLGELVALCGGLKQPDAILVDGGPLQGKVQDPARGVRMASRVLLALPPDHPLIERKNLSIDNMLRRSSSICAGCSLCTDRCPRALQGYQLKPHLLMRALSLRLDTLDEVVFGAGSCIGCGVCEAVCSGNLSPGRLYASVASELRSKGLNSLPTRALREPHPQWPERRVPRDWLTARLGLAPYAGPLTVEDNYLAVPRVRFFLKGLEPLVDPGQFVEAGTPLARPTGAGVRLHSPIAGQVTRLVPGGLLEVEAGHATGAG